MDDICSTSRIVAEYPLFLMLGFLHDSFEVLRAINPDDNFVAAFLFARFLYVIIHRCKRLSQHFWSICNWQEASVLNQPTWRHVRNDVIVPKQIE